MYALGIRRPGSHDRHTCAAPGCHEIAVGQVIVLYRGGIELIAACPDHMRVILDDQAPPKPAAAPWTEDDMTELVRLTASEIPPAEIAAKLGRSVDAIKQMRRKIAPDLVQTNHWSTTEKEILEAMLEEGASRRDIAARLDRSMSAVKQMRRKLLNM